MRIYTVGLLALLMAGSVIAKPEQFSDVIYLEKSAQTTATETTEGIEKKHIGVFYKVRAGASAESIELAAIEASVIARDLQDFLRYHSGGRWDIKSEGFGMASDCNPLPPLMCSGAARRVDTKTFVPNYWHTVDNVSAGFCGQAQYLGAISINYYFGMCGQATTNHEIGHNLGLMHDGVRDAFGNEAEYGTTSIMGKGGGRRSQGMSAFHRVLLGFETARETLRVDSTQQILMTSTEMPPEVLRENEWQNIQISGGYWLSMRKERGTRYPVSGGREDSIYIHYVDSSDRGNMKLLIPVMDVGSTRFLPNGIEIIYHEFNAETARVTIQYPDQGTAEPLAMPTNPPIPPPGSMLDESHSGLWYKPEYDGQGFDVMVKGDRVLVYWYTYDQAAEQQRYYIGAGEIQEGASAFDLYTTANATFFNPSADVIKAGTAQLYFDDNGGVFHWETAEHGRGALNLTRLATTLPSDLNGSWYNPARDGEGLSIQQFGNTMVVYWYTYDNNGNQKWYTMIGNPDALTMYETSGGMWQFFDDVNAEIIGSANLLVTDGGVILNYDSPKLGTSSRPMVRLF